MKITTKNLQYGNVSYGGRLFTLRIIISVLIAAIAFAMSTVDGGALAGAARSACQNRIQAAYTKKERVKQQNTWIGEKLSKYK